jgi:hypothetical protein
MIGPAVQQGGRECVNIRSKPHDIVPLFFATICSIILRVTVNQNIVTLSLQNLLKIKSVLITK